MKYLPIVLLAATVKMFGQYGIARENTFKKSGDIFGTRLFIENKGQFDKAASTEDQIFFAFDHGSEQIYFTKKGLIHKFVKNVELSEEAREGKEKLENVRGFEPEIHFVKMNWVGANADVRIERGEKSGHYLTYGPPSLNSYGYKTLTYKNLYDNIDVEYTIPQDKAYGIKYNVIVHPGADPAKVKMLYSGAVEKIKSMKNGDVIIKTPLEDITEHAPVSYYDDRQPVSSEFKVLGNQLQFSLPSGYQSGKKLIIDPWLTTITTASTNNYGYDVDYDNGGNVFIYGGTTPAKIAKYNSTGTLLWTFSGVLTSPSWTGGSYIGNFVVIRTNSKCYTGQGFSGTGTQIIRLDAAGNYDNLITPAHNSWREVWDMAYHCSTGNVYGMGGSTSSNESAGIVNQSTGTLTPIAFVVFSGSTAGYDVVSHAIDDAGEFFWIYAGPGLINNKMARINSAFTSSVWVQPSTFSSMNECANKQYVGGPGSNSSNGFNCLAVNQNYLYYYDGFNLAAYNKTNGAFIASTTIAGQTLKNQGGIAVDDCDILYLGGNGSILSYSFSGTAFSALTSIPLGATTTNKHVFDIKMDKVNKILYITGSGFVGTYSAANSTNCVPLSVICYNPFPTDLVICAGTSLTITPINYGNMSNPTYSINPGGITSSTGTFVLTPLTNVNYTTYVTGTNTNSAVQTITAAVNVTVNPQPITAVTVTQATCYNPTNGFNLNLSFNPPSAPAYTVYWTPSTPAGITSNTQTALPQGTIAPGTYTATIITSLGCSTVTTFTINGSPAPANFFVTPGGPSYLINCYNPVLTLTFSPSAYSYTMSHIAAPPYIGNTPVFTGTNNLGTYTITALNPVSGCMATKTISIAQNTAMPSAVISPTFQNITCSLTNIANVTAVSNPTVNIQHLWMAPSGGTLTANTPTASYPPGGPGVYTHCIKNLTNGCQTCRTFTVTSNDSFPVFNVLSPENYTLGCSTRSVANINIINGNTRPPGGAVSYTLLSPTDLSAPGGILSNKVTYSVNVPGTYTVITRDNVNFCDTRVYISIISNTFSPGIDTLILPRTTLTCFDPSVTLQGLSTMTNVSYNWAFPSNPGNQAGSTITVNANTLAVTSSVVANYTFSIVDNSSLCKTTTVIPVVQNLYPPVPDITGANLITCKTETILLTNNSKTSIPDNSFPKGKIIRANLWTGPTPQLPQENTSTYIAYMPGTYTMVVQDLNNGCTSVTTKTVGDFREYPVVNRPDPPKPFTLDCGEDTVSITAIITPTLASFSYSWTEFPGANTGLRNQRYLITDSPGRYEVYVTNEANGCISQGFVDVVLGKLDAGFTAEPENGYAPLLVTFTNNSRSSKGTLSLTTVWSFGNHRSEIAKSTTVTPVVMYEQPGTYSVAMIAQKGNCIDTVVKFINVEIPSSINIPNIFTPNGDGSNDVFFLKTANLTEINIRIYDRWGHTVYQVKSDKGNIAWDGKNQFGKDVPDGTYFYVLTASGRDGKEFEQKGNVTLVR